MRASHAAALGIFIVATAAIAQPASKPKTLPPLKPLGDPGAAPGRKSETPKLESAPAESTTPGATGASRAAVPFPHPIITEVLYAVPTGTDGDASRDGARNATGDEFIELVNPHEKPIQLLGYTLSDESQGDKSKVKFTFPACELRPGQVVVVFNGYGASWSGPVGDARVTPRGPNEGFEKAFVFSMRTTTNRAALNNTGDSVTLSAPAARVIQRVRWGTSAQSAGAPAPGVLDEVLPETSKSSAQRSGILPGSAWRMHNELVPGVIFSPGRYEMDVAVEATAPTPQIEPEKMTGPGVIPAKR